MMRIRAYFVLLCVAGASFYVHAVHKVEMKLKDGKLTLKNLDETKKLFTVAEESPLVQRFFENGIFVFDMNVMKQDLEKKKEQKEIGAPVTQEQETPPAPLLPQNLGQEDEPSQEESGSIEKEIPQEQSPQAPLQSKNIPVKEKESVIMTVSYRTLVKSIQSQEAQAILKRQAYATQTYYMMRALWKGDPRKQAREVVWGILGGLYNDIKSMSEVTSGTPFVFDIENEQMLIRYPDQTAIYKKIRDLGLAIGFGMPSIEKPWYIRHKGKIAFTAGVVGTALILMALSRYGTPVAGTQKTATSAASTKPAVATTQLPGAPTASKSWLAKSLAAVKAKLNTAVSNVKSSVMKTASTEIPKATSKAIVSRFAAKEGIGPTSGVQGLKEQAGDIVGHALTQELAGAYGYKLVPIEGSTIPRPLEAPAWVRKDIVNRLLSPEGAGLEASYRLWQ